MTHRIAQLTVCMIAAAALSVACSKKAPDTAAPATADTTKSEASVSTPGAGGLTPQQIADTLSKPVCKRKVTCNPGEGNESDCVASLSKDMATNLSDAAKAITQAQMDTCLAAITKATCEQFMGDKPPAGCEWLQ